MIFLQIDLEWRAFYPFYPLLRGGGRARPCYHVLPCTRGHSRDFNHVFHGNFIGYKGSRPRDVFFGLMLYYLETEAVYDRNRH